MRFVGRVHEMTWSLPLLVVAALALNGCGDDDEASPTSPSAASSPSPAPSTHLLPPAATPSVTSAPVIPTDSEDYAIALIEAWERGDRDAAATFADPDDLETLFSREGGGAGTWSLEGCEGAMGSTYCTFRADGEPVRDCARRQRGGVAR